LTEKWIPEFGKRVGEQTFKKWIFQKMESPDLRPGTS
jgi:hypothetical protein